LYDPTLKLKTPPPAKPKRNSLKQKEAARLHAVLNSLPLNRNTLAVYIGLATGMRRGEVLALRWQNVDFDDMAINVTGSLNSKGNLKEPKTKAGYRKITLDNDTIDLLKKWKTSQAQALLKLGIGQADDTPVCSNRRGKFCYPNRFYRWFQNFCVDNGFAVFVDKDGVVLPRVRLNAKGHPVDAKGRCYTRGHKKPKPQQFYRGLKFHELRHTQATLLIASGIDIKTVQDRLGHACAAMTLDFYAHPVEARDREATEVFNNLLNTSKPKRRRRNTA
jgi:integrase